MVQTGTGKKPHGFHGLLLCSRRCFKRLTCSNSWNLHNSPMRENHPTSQLRMWKPRCGQAKWLSKMAQLICVSQGSNPGGASAPQRGAAQTRQQRMRRGTREATCEWAGKGGTGGTGRGYRCQLKQVPLLGATLSWGGRLAPWVCFPLFFRQRSAVTTPDTLFQGTSPSCHAVWLMKGDNAPAFSTTSLSSDVPQHRWP